MADNLFQVEIITPDRIFYRGQASMIEFTTTEGEIGVFKDSHSADDSSGTGDRDDHGGRRRKEGRGACRICGDLGGEGNTSCRGG